MKFFLKKTIIKNNKLILKVYYIIYYIIENIILNIFIIIKKNTKFYNNNLYIINLDIYIRFLFFLYNLFYSFFFLYQLKLLYIFISILQIYAY